MYFPDQEKDSNNKSMYSKIWSFYDVLSKSSKLSESLQKFRDSFLTNIKWLSSSLRFYRNEFIEHLDKGYQQGMNFGFYQNLNTSPLLSIPKTKHSHIPSLKNQIHYTLCKMP